MTVVAVQHLQHQQHRHLPLDPNQLRVGKMERKGKAQQQNTLQHHHQKIQQQQNLHPSLPKQVVNQDAGLWRNKNKDNSALTIHITHVVATLAKASEEELLLPLGVVPLPNLTSLKAFVTKL